MSRSGAATFKGNPITLAGEEVQVGQPAPDFKLHFFDNGMQTLTLAAIMSGIERRRRRRSVSLAKRRSDEAGAELRARFAGAPGRIPEALRRSGQHLEGAIAWR